MPHSQELTGRHVLLIFLAFFALVFAVNAYFITVALSTYSGVVANEPYRKGLKYNERIADEERQHQLGWSEDIALSKDGSKLTIAVRDRDGEPVQRLKLTGTLGRPATTRADIALMLNETAPGRYEAAVELEGNGNYIASIEATDPARSETGVLYRARKRLWLER